MSVTVRPRRTAVEDHQCTSAATQPHIEAGSEGSAFRLVHQRGGRQCRDERKHAALDREQSVVTLDRPRAPGGSGDVMAMDRAFLQQVTRHRRRRQADALQPADGRCW
jgi:hypothetical protein